MKYLAHAGVLLYEVFLMLQKAQNKIRPIRHKNQGWRSLLANTRLKLWKLGAMPYNTLVFTAAAIVIVQAKAWKIRDH